MTFEEYIDNPLGKKNMVFSKRYVYRDLYTVKFDKIFAREAGKIKYTLFTDNKYRYIFYVAIPSEVVHRFTYDIVVEFYTKNDKVASSQTLNKYDVRFFSNDPWFTFTFAYAFNKHDLLFQDLKKKIPDRCINTSAKIRNSESLVGYVKSLYFAYLFYKMKSIDKKVTWYNAIQYDKNELFRIVMPSAEKIRLRQELGAKEEKRVRKLSGGKKSSKTMKSNIKNVTKKTMRTKVSKKVSTVKRI